MTPAQRVTFLLIALLTVGRTGAAQSAAPEKDPCGSPKGGFTFWFSYRLCGIARNVPQDPQVEAPSVSTGSTTLVEKATAPDIFSLALGLAGAGGKPGEDETATSMTVSAFAIRASVTGDNPLNPTVYGRHRNWRRYAFTAGRAQGDADTPDGRIFGLKALLIDHRDVSDSANKEPLGKVADLLTAMGGSTGQGYRKALAFVARALDPDKFTQAGMNANDIEAAVNTFAETQLELENYEETMSRLNEGQLAALDQLLQEEALKVAAAQNDIAALIRSIRHAPQLAVTYQAVVRPQDADDEHHFGVVFDVGLASRLSATVNGSFVRTDHKFLEDTNVAKVAGEMQFDLQRLANFGDLVKRKGRDPMTISLAGLGEWYSDDGPTIGKLQVKLTIPMPGLLAGLKIPVSVTFANRTEFIDEKEVRGNIGFTVDLAKLQNSLGAFRR